MIGIVSAVLILVTLYLVSTAPEGYEDENGYHEGRPPEEDDEGFFF